MIFGRTQSYSTDDFSGLINACRNRNARAQKVLFEQFFGFAKGICMRYTSNKEEAEEVLNDAFLKVFLKIDYYDDNVPFKAWLRTIVVNTAIDFYRKNQKFLGQIELEKAPEPFVSESVIEQMSSDEILGVVQTLKPVYRTTFLMYAVDGYSHREIAEILDTNEATVRSNYLRARGKLQELLKKSHKTHSDMNQELYNTQYHEAR